MAFDSGMIASLVGEIKAKLLCGRVDKIYQPQKDEMDIYIRTQGKSYILVISLMSGSPRIYLTNEQKENPSNPPSFCVLARKYLLSAQLTDISQPDFERAVVLSFNARDEMGFITVKKLVIELMGKYTNMILCEQDGKILGLYKTVDFTTSKLRQLLPGMKYQMPPSQNKINPLNITAEQFNDLLLSGKNHTIEKLLVRSFTGISPLVAREVSYILSGRTDSTADDFQLSRIFEVFKGIIDKINNNDFSPCAIIIDGKPKEFSFIEIKQYGNCVKSYDSPSAMIEECYKSKEHEGLVNSKAHDIFRVLTNAEKRIRKKLEIQTKELEQCAQKDELKKYGDLITANLYMIKQGDECVTLNDYYSDDMPQIKVMLDKRRSPAKNAQYYYKKYGKLKNAEIILKTQTELAKRELDYVASVFDALARAKTPSELEEIRQELIIAGFIPKHKAEKKSAMKKQKIKLTEYKTENGYRVLCGANNIQNDYLTFSVASKRDYWFHIKNAPGSHVVLVCDGLAEPQAKDFTQAANIAAVNSALRSGQLVTVDYTLVKNIKKPPSSKPGFVTYSSNYSAYITPDENECKELRIK